MSDDLFDLFKDLDDTNELIEVDRTEYQRAPFAMPGAKYRSLHEIIPRLPITRSCTWADHCGGTGVVSWNVPTCKVMMFNDRYSGIVAFYRVLRDPIKKDQLLKYLSEMPPHSREEWLDCRAMWVTEEDDVARAAKWYYMTRLSILNKRQAFGRGITMKFAPIGDMSDVRLLFDSIHPILKNFTLENLDLKVSFLDYDTPSTIHYIDPPYVNTDQGTYEDKWTHKDNEDLFRLIANSKGFVAFSHYYSSEIDKQSFWTNRYTWSTRVTTEPLIARAENHKLERTDEFGEKEALECLWIKEPR